MEREELRKLKVEAKSKNITNRELAEVVGLSESMISKVFNYKATTSEHNLAKMKHYVETKRIYKWVQVPIA
ncbi:helix-turn-helix domain-containing protein [Sutcliffiella sp. NC1]|uniref:helix-turn-helix domain-containing protein n=1 Tax=Sutcliffiella sp. NC1 TaxID=3004096 RepID=UPI0022DDE3AD|nr:helix-turn-helix transcriptional regulator [Sutcliffiella sp. NC1]WBL16348.1 helix-turn-helix transcriptional regulator [Sutcliffiella sp. NC1]